MEIVKLIGSDVLPDDQKLILETARVIRTGFLQQNAYHKEDTYVPMDKQVRMMQLILNLHHKAVQLVTEKSIPVSAIEETDAFNRLVRIKYDVPNDHPEAFGPIWDEISAKLDALQAPRKEGDAV